MKYNLSLLKNRRVGFDIYKERKNPFTPLNNKRIRFSSVVKNVKQGKEYITFTFENDTKLDVNMLIFYNLLIRYDKEKDIVWLIEDKNKEYMTSFVGFTMFDTYGFPIEMTQEIMEEKGYKIDMEGFEVLRKLQKDMSSGTFKNNNAF